MEQYIQWRAFDGELFESEEECAAYEARLERSLETFTFYKDGSPIPCHSLEDLEQAYNLSDVIRIKDVPYWKEDLGFIDSYWGWLIPDAPGLYRYNEEDLLWEEIEESELKG